MASTAPRDVRSPVDTKHSPKPANAVRPQPEMAPAFWKVARFLGSLQFAIVTGTIFTIAMIIGTCLESWYSAKIAQELVYYSWWFLILLSMLACAIFFAAVKKWPWKKHQTGFLITHLGLLTILAGGVLNSIWGVDALMALVDSPNVHRSMKTPGRMALLAHDSVLTVSRPHVKNGKEDWLAAHIPFNPGPLPWGTDLQSADTIPLLIRILDVIAHPLPYAFGKEIEPNLRLEVIAHLPHTNIEPVEAASEKEFGYPALKVEINTREGGHVPAKWIGLNERPDQGPRHYHLPDNQRHLLDFLGRTDPIFLDEFLKPPSDQERGKLGQLVFAIAGKKHRIDVATQLGKTVPLGNSGWKVAVEKYIPRDNATDADDIPWMPRVQCVVTGPDGTSRKYRVKARGAIFSPVLNSFEEERYETPADMPGAWYHPPDLRFGLNRPGTSMYAKHCLQFLLTTDNKLYYRSLTERGTEIVLEHAGPAPVVGSQKLIWEDQAANFVIEEYLPHAKRCEQRIVPVLRRPGLVSEEEPAALLCRLTLTKKDRRGTPHQFVKETWVPFRLRDDEHDPLLLIQGTLDGQPFTESMKLQFYHEVIDLGFSLQLARAESFQDPGTTHAATFTSYVKLYDTDRGYNGQDFMITMNEPLDHRGYKFYQSRFAHLGTEPQTGKPIHQSVFTVGFDPGLWFKYIGTAMIGVGIATMYYMKAYFFKNTSLFSALVWPKQPPSSATRTPS